MRLAPVLLALACAACGARTPLDPGDDAFDALDASAARRDAGTPPPPARSCWSEPNCIEADFTASDVRYREVGTVEPTSRALYLNGEEREGVALLVKLMRDATPGVQPYDPDDGNVFVSARLGDGGGCGLFADVELTRVDVSPGGVTEGTFEGRLIGCDELDAIRDGRFRLTAP